MPNKPISRKINGFRKGQLIDLRTFFEERKKFLSFFLVLPQKHNNNYAVLIGFVFPHDNVKLKIGRQAAHFVFLSSPIRPFLHFTAQKCTINDN